MWASWPRPKIGLLHRQGVHVGAEGKDLSRARAADLGSESVVRPVLCEGNSEFPKLFFHIGPGSRQASSGLRDAVQIPSVFCDDVLEFTAVFPHGFPPLRSFSFEDFLQCKDDQVVNLFIKSPEDLLILLLFYGLLQRPGPRDPGC